MPDLHAVQPSLKEEEGRGGGGGVTMDKGKEDKMQVKDWDC
jgi:hypothetical protein